MYRVAGLDKMHSSLLFLFLLLSVYVFFVLLLILLLFDWLAVFVLVAAAAVAGGGGGGGVFSCAVPVLKTRAGFHRQCKFSRAFSFK